jgi:hypothetical protein
MLKTPATLCCMLLGAASLFSQVSSPQLTDPRITDGEFHWFSLAETPEEIASALGPPQMTAPFADFVSWQYQIGVEDEHEFSHQLVFRKDGRLVSITRNYETERIVDEWFPADMTEVHSHRSAEGQAFSISVRRLSEGRLLLGMGISGLGQKTGQIVLIKQSELRYFYSWLSDEVERTQ